VTFGAAVLLSLIIGAAALLCFAFGIARLWRRRAP